MSRKEKPLPKPPNRAFGGRKQFEQEEEQGALIADRMAAAMAEGKLDEFLKKEMPDNEYARSLARMMMNMSGMTPKHDEQPAPQSPEKKEQPNEASSMEVPEDVRSATRAGDIQGLMDLLRREHQKRAPGIETKPEEGAAASPSAAQPTIDKDVIDALIRIASDNGVTLDWIILRAIKVYVQEYKKTGKL